jgi:acetyl esterase/lipase
MTDRHFCDPEIHAGLSAEAKAIFKSVIAPASMRPKGPIPKSHEDFALLAKQAENAFSTSATDYAYQRDIAVHLERLGGVDCLFVEPPQSEQHLERVLFYVHGGAFVTHSARSTLQVASRLALHCNCLVVSVDYTLAPVANWRIIQNQIMQAINGFQAKYPAIGKIGAVADSAGAAILMGALLQMRAHGVKPPRAVSLLCPVADLEMSGETIKTNAALDLLNDAHFLRACFDAYAAPEDQRNGFVSPTRGHFENLFLAVQILAAGHDIFLSDARILSERLLAAGIESELDVYEKMPHGFHLIYADAPE